MLTVQCQPEITRPLGTIYTMYVSGPLWPGLVVPAWSSCVPQNAVSVTDPVQWVGPIRRICIYIQVHGRVRSVLYLRYAPFPR